MFSGHWEHFPALQLGQDALFAIPSDSHAGGMTTKLKDASLDFYEEVLEGEVEPELSPRDGGEFLNERYPGKR